MAKDGPVSEREVLESAVKAVRAAANHLAQSERFTSAAQEVLDHGGELPRFDMLGSYDRWREANEAAMRLIEEWEGQV